MTSLMGEILVLKGVVEGIVGGKSLDELDCLCHVRVLGLFRCLYFHSELIDEIRLIQDASRMVSEKHVAEEK